VGPVAVLPGQQQSETSPQKGPGRQVRRGKGAPGGPTSPGGLFKPIGKSGRQEWDVCWGGARPGRFNGQSACFSGPLRLPYERQGGRDFVLGGPFRGGKPRPRDIADSGWVQEQRGPGAGAQGVVRSDPMGGGAGGRSRWQGTEGGTGPRGGGPCRSVAFRFAVQGLTGRTLPIAGQAGLGGPGFTKIFRKAGRAHGAGREKKGERGARGGPELGDGPGQRGTTPTTSQGTKTFVAGGHLGGVTRGLGRGNATGPTHGGAIMSGEECLGSGRFLRDSWNGLGSFPRFDFNFGQSSLGGGDPVGPENERSLWPFGSFNGIP